MTLGEIIIEILASVLALILVTMGSFYAMFFVAALFGC